MPKFIAEVDETVVVNVTYCFEAESEDDALEQMRNGIKGPHQRCQDGEPETVLSRDERTIRVYPQDAVNINDLAVSDAPIQRQEKLERKNQ